MGDLKTPVSQTIRYEDGTETTVHYRSLGVKMDEEKVLEPVEPAESEAPAVQE